VDRADKGKTVVIINRDTLRQTVEHFIQNNNILPLNKDPTEQYHKQVSQVLQKFNPFIPRNQHKYLLQIKPNAPQLNALIKTHKIDNPIRPVINCIKAPSYKLSRHLNKLLNNLTALPYTYATKNTYDLAQELAKLHIAKHHRLVTLGIKDLYVNLPIPAIINSTTFWLRKNNHQQMTINQVTQLMKTVLSQNYFQYDGKYYKHSTSIAMGCPLSRNGHLTPASVFQGTDH
jgi:fructosamine-3-kinase